LTQVSMVLAQAKNPPRGLVARGSRPLLDGHFQRCRLIEAKSCNVPLEILR
jgi:hypothetical protein